MLKIDFHMHTHHSSDSDMSPETLVQTARKAGLDGMAVTNHNTMEGVSEVEKLAGNLIVFRGEEIRTLEGDIIALQIKDLIEKELDLVQTCKLVKDQKGFIIVPHPFDTLRHGVGRSIDRILQYVDAIEGLNARCYTSGFNKRAVVYAEANGLPLVAGSDSHFAGEIGYAYTLVDSRPNKKDILRAISDGKTKIFGKRSGLKPHARTFMQRFRG